MKGRLASKIEKGGWARAEKEAPGNPPKKRKKERMEVHKLMG